MSDTATCKNELQIQMKKGIHRAWTSEEEVIMGARWMLYGSTDVVSTNKSHLFKVTCNGGKCMRGCEAEATIRLELGDEGQPGHRTYETSAVFNHKSQDVVFCFKNGEILRNGIRFGCFDDAVFDANFPFKLTLIVNSVKGQKVLGDIPRFQFRDPGCPHDKVLVLDDGSRFYVQSQILSTFSSYFNTLFNSNFAESKQDEIVIQEVIAEDFERLLRSMYPYAPDLADECSTVFRLLEMAFQFDVPILVQKCVKAICEHGGIGVDNFEFKCMELADRFHLLDLQDHAYDCLESMDSLKEHMEENKEQFEKLPLSTREMILYAYHLRKW